MDTEEGVEVVWNEVMFSERRNFKLLQVRLTVREKEENCYLRNYALIVRIVMCDVIVQFSEYGNIFYSVNSSKICLNQNQIREIKPLDYFQ